jgi:hypothetical protein
MVDTNNEALATPAATIALTVGNERTPLGIALLARHTIADHATLTRSAAAWRALAHRGTQHVEAGARASETAYDLELRNCSCGTTLSRKVTSYRIELYGETRERYGHGDLRGHMTFRAALSWLGQDVWPHRALGTEQSGDDCGVYVTDAGSDEVLARIYVEGYAS